MALELLQLLCMFAESTKCVKYHSIQIPLRIAKWSILMHNDH